MLYRLNRLFLLQNFALPMRNDSSKFAISIFITLKAKKS